jgi:hypothetical protein
MTPTETFIQRKRIESPHSRTLRMLEVALDGLADVSNYCDSTMEIEHRASEAFALCDRIASEPPNATQQVAESR